MRLPLAPGPSVRSPALFGGPGAARALARAVDWSATPLGPVRAWPEPLRTVVRTCLDAPTALAVWAGAGLTLLHNDAYLPLLAGAASRAMGRPAPEVWATGADGRLSQLSAVRETGVGTVREERRRVTRADGREEEASFESAVSPVRDAAGRVVAVLEQCHETSTEAAARLDGALRSATERLVVAASAGGIGIYDFDVERGTIDWDARLRALWGLSPDEPVTYETFLAGIVPEDRAATDAAVRRALAPGGAGEYSAEYRVRSRRDGGERWVFATGRVTFAAGRPVRLVGTAQDVTARKEAEVALRASEDTARRQLAEIQSIYASARVGLCVLDRELRFTRINRRLAELNGMRPEDHLGRTVEEVVPALAPTARAIARRIFETGEGVLDVELVGTTPSQPGVERTFVEQWLPIRDGAGALIGVNVVAEDVTEQRRAEEALRASEERRRAMADALPALVFIHDSAGRNTYVNQRYTEFTGVVAEALLGHGYSALFHPEDAPRYRARFEEALATRHTFECEYRIRRRDGAWRWHLARSVPWRHGPDGAPAEWVGTSTDITDLKRAEELVSESERRFAVMFRRSPLAKAWSKLPDGILADVNDAWVELTGIPREEALGRTTVELGLVASEERRGLYEALTAHGSARSEVTITSRSRGPRVVSTKAELVTVGGERFMLAAMQDVTELREAERALRDSDRRKTEFLAVLSHELRNPLAPIRNSIVLLDTAPPGSAAATRAMEILRRQTGHLARLVDDLLDLSRITHGKVQVQLAPADVRELVRRAYLDAKALFDARDVDLILSDSAEPLWVAADAARFAQMVGNLLHNALKFTPPGGRVVVEATPRGPRCEVRVRDTGQGLAAGDLERIFDPFEQALRTQDGSGGLGLGLALVKGLAEKHGGSVRASSDGPGTGAEFVISLPLAEAPPPAAPAAPARRRTAPLTVVVIEDNEDAATTLAELLALAGHRVTTAGTGAAGVSAVAAERPDVLICDLGLPDMSGLDVIRAIRAAEDGARVFATALTGNAQPQDRDAALAAGFDAHLPKPPPLEELYRLLAEVARRAHRAAPEA